MKICLPIYFCIFYIILLTALCNAPSSWHSRLRNLGKRAPGRRVFVNPNKPIKIFITTFNAGGAFPTPDHMRAWIGRNWIGSGKPDLFVIALQEIIELNVGNMLNKDAAKARKKEWLIVLQKVLPYGYDLIRSVRMFGLFLAVYHRPSFGVRVSEVGFIK